LNSPFELSSLEQIEEMDKMRLQAIQALEISNNSVKRQNCGVTVPMLRDRPSQRAIELMLCKNGKWIENHSHGNAITEVKQIKQELAELLEEEARADALRRLPLYSCRITGFKFVCSKCYDKVYMLSAITKKALK
jgi:hypothetical protein